MLSFLCYKRFNSVLKLLIIGEMLLSRIAKYVFFSFLRSNKYKFLGSVKRYLLSLVEFFKNLVKIFEKACSLHYVAFGKASNIKCLSFPPMYFLFQDL